MKPLPLILASAAAGAIGGVVVTTFVAPPRVVAEPAAVGPAPDAALLALMDALAADDRALEERLEQLESRPVPVPRLPVDGFVSVEDFEAFRDEVREALATGSARVPDPAALEESVAEALTSIRKDEAAQRIRAFQEQRARRFEEDLANLEKKLDLSPYQVGEMRSTLIAQHEREEEIRRLWEEGSDPEAVGELKRESQEALQGDLQRFLTPEQLRVFGGTGK